MKTNAASLADFLRSKLGTVRPDTPAYDVAYMQVLNWLHGHYDGKALKTEALRLLRQIDPDTDFSPVEDWHFTALGKVAIIANAGFPLRPATRDWMVQKTNVLRQQLGRPPLEPEIVPAEPEITAAPKRRNGITAKTADLVGMLGMFIESGNLSEPGKALDLVRERQLTAPDLRDIQDKLRGRFGHLTGQDQANLKMAERSRAIRSRWTYEAVMKQLDAFGRAGLQSGP